MYKRALITGITGQDGAYLAELLLDKGYQVHGLIRRSSNDNLVKLRELLGSKVEKLFLHYGDLTDSSLIFHLLKKIEPSEVYNLAAQSHVGVSFEMPEYTAEVDALGPLRILEAIRILGLKSKTKFYQASTSELYGKVKEIPQSEVTPFNPTSPYAIAKQFAYYTTVNYRTSYDMFACNGILFNHESPLRGEDFVTRKITLGLSRIACGVQDILYMGNLDAKRDWGHAKDYVKMQWLMLQQDEPDDYVIATGKNYTVREFIEKTANYLGISLEWRGSQLSEEAIHKESGKTLIAINPDFFRPSEVDSLLGNPHKAKEKLGWTPSYNLDQLIQEMVDADLAKIKVSCYESSHRS